MLSCCPQKFWQKQPIMINYILFAIITRFPRTFFVQHSIRRQCCRAATSCPGFICHTKGLHVITFLYHFMLIHFTVGILPKNEKDTHWFFTLWKPKNKTMLYSMISYRIRDRLRILVARVPKIFFFCPTLNFMLSNMIFSEIKIK